MQNILDKSAPCSISPEVSIVPCADYGEEAVRAALTAVLAPFGGLGWVTPGMRVAVKVNLLGAHKPEKAATTHPALVTQLCRMLVARGASVVVGDSPGGFFTRAFLSPVYLACGMHAVTDTGARLNDDFSETDVSNPDGLLLRAFRCTRYLLEADAIIDVCKLKTHGLMAYTGAVKNMFGAIPGMKKSELHYQFSRTDAFAGMLIDLYARMRPRLCIADAVTIMEGNGPSVGTPRHMGALLAAENGHALDLLGARLMGLGVNDVPTLKAAFARGYVPETAEQLSVNGAWLPFVAKDFCCTPIRSVISWGTGNPVLARAMERALADRPAADGTLCTGCGVCARHCPIHAVTMKGKRPLIDRGACIRCFCCQEFCPAGAMQKRRPPLAKWLYR